MWREWRERQDLRARTDRVEPARASFRLAQDYTLPADQAVRGVQTAFATVTIEGRVEGDVVAVLGRVQVASTASILGSLVVIGGNASIQQGATVGRDLVVVGGALDAPATFAPGGEYVVIGLRGLGDTVQGIVPWFTRGLLWGRLIVPELPWLWGLVGLVFFVGVVLNLLFDSSVKAAAGALVAKPLSAYLTGLLVLLLMGPMLVLLAASLIGLIVVPFVACAILVASILGKIAVARAMGGGVMHESEEGNSRVLGLRSFVIGFAILCVACMIPIVGLLTWMTAEVFGLGAATMALFAALKRERPPAARPPAAPATTGFSAPTGTATPAGTAAAAVGAPTPASAWTAEGTGLDTTLPPSSPGPGGAASVAPVDLSIYPRATFLDRLAAFALDCILVGIASAILDFGHEGGFFALLLAYHIAFWAWKGTTLGGIITGLRVIRVQGAEMRFVDALVRGLSSVFSVAALGIGCFWMLQDPERQMWHDKIAGTVVLKVPRELVLA